MEFEKLPFEISQHLFKKPRSSILPLLFFSIKACTNISNLVILDFRTLTHYNLNYKLAPRQANEPDKIGQTRCRIHLEFQSPSVTYAILYLTVHKPTYEFYYNLLPEQIIATNLDQKRFAIFSNATNTLTTPSIGT